MTRSCIDCNWEARLISQKRRKLGRNCGELVSHRFVAVYISFERHLVTNTFHILVAHIAHD